MSEKYSFALWDILESSVGELSHLRKENEILKKKYHLLAKWNNEAIQQFGMAYESLIRFIHIIQFKDLELDFEEPLDFFENFDLYCDERNTIILKESLDAIDNGYYPEVIDSF